MAIVKTSDRWAIGTPYYKPPTTVITPSGAVYTSIVNKAGEKQVLVVTPAEKYIVDSSGGRIGVSDEIIKQAVEGAKSPTVAKLLTKAYDLPDTSRVGEIVDMGGIDTGITIGLSDAEKQQIANAEAMGQCPGGICAYYTPRDYTVSGWDKDHNWVQIPVTAISEQWAKQKAQDAGYDVKSVTTQIEGLKPRVTTPKTDPVKDYLEEKGATWKDEYAMGGGYNLVVMLDDAVDPAKYNNFTVNDLRIIFGGDAVKEATNILPQYRAYEDLQPYLHTTPSDPYGTRRDRWMPPLTYNEEVNLGELIRDKGQNKAVELLTNAGVEDAQSFIDAYNEMPEHWQIYADEHGFTALQFKVDSCANVLKKYKQEDGSYDIYSALLDPEDWQLSAQHQGAISFLFGSEVTSQALDSLRTMRQEVTAPYPVPGDQVGGKDVKSLWDKAEETLHTVGVYTSGANPLPVWVLDNMYSSEAQAYMRAYSEGYAQSPWYKRLFTDIAVTYLSPEKLEALPNKYKRILKDNGVDISKGLYCPVVGGYGPMVVPASTAIGAALTKVGGSLVKIPRWYWRAPSQTIFKVASKIPGLMTTPIIRGIPQMAAIAVRMVTVGVPAYYTASYIAERVKETDLQRKWNIFTNLPDKEKNEWAIKAGYEKWEGLEESKQAVVLARYAVPTSYTTTEWAAALGEYIEKLVKLGEKGADWIFGQESPVPDTQEMGIGGKPVQYVGAFGLGTGVGLAEGLMYMAAIPLVLTNIFIRVPTGEAWGYTKWVAGGMMEFFKEVPSVFISGPFGAGRMIGLFVLSPESVYKLGKGALTVLRPSYVPERGMAIKINTIRVVFSAKQLDLLSEMSAAQLKLLGTRIAATLMEGKNYVRGFGRIKLEIKTVPYQKVVGNALWHFTPDITPFLKGKQIPIVGKLYTSPQAAISAGVQSLVRGIKAIKPGLVEVRVPSGYTIKGAPIEKLLASGKAVEIEAPLKGVLDPIPGFTGKGVSSNMYFGTYPIRRFTLHGVDTPVVKLSFKKLLEIRALAMKEAVVDFVLGWSGRLEAVKRDLAGSKQLKQTLRNVDNSIKTIKDSPDSIIGKDGRIVSQIEFKHPSGGAVAEKVRGLIIDKDGRVLFVRDRADPVGVYDAVGGSCNVKEVLIPSKGKWNYELPAGERPPITWELAFRSQAFGELNIVIKRTNNLGMYRGKVGEHSVYGTRVFEGYVDTPYFNRVTAWRKYQKPTYRYAEPEIAEAFWWDGKSSPRGAVQPWFYDMLAAVARKYGWDMSKLKISTVSGRFVRDLSFPDRVIRGKNPDLTSTQRKVAEIGRLKATYGEMMMPSVRDYVLRGGADITLMVELLKGRRQAVKWVSNKPSDLLKAGDYLVKSIRTLRDKIARMSKEAYQETYGNLGVSKQDLLTRLDITRLEQALKNYIANKTKANRVKLEEAIERLNNAQIKLFERWLVESNIKEYLDMGVVSGRYTAYLNRLGRVAAAGNDIYEIPVWDELPEYEVVDLPTVDYVLDYAVRPYGERGFTYKTAYSMPTYTELGKYPNYAKQPTYQETAKYKAPTKYVTQVYKPPIKVPIGKGLPPIYPPYPPYPPRPPRPPVSKQKVVLIMSGGKNYYKLPQGSIAWRQGSKLRGKVLHPQWYYIPPPWMQEKPISLDYPPLGAKNTGDTTPDKTIQMIGKAKGKVPKSASVDLGIMDIKIDNYGKDISFKSGGLETNVGQRIASPTVGLSIPAGGIMKMKYRGNGRKKRGARRELVQSASAV